MIFLFTAARSIRNSARAWAFNYPPGIFYSFGSDYEQDEMIGFGGDVKIPSTPATDWLGTAHFLAETFFLDTTALSNSLFGHPPPTDMFIERPGHLSLADGGAANTNGFDSFTLALQGRDIFGATGAGYHLSFTHAGVHLPDEEPETVFSAAGTYNFDLGDNLATQPYVEYARLNNFDGQRSSTAIMRFSASPQRATNGSSTSPVAHAKAPITLPRLICGICKKTSRFPIR